MMDLNEYRESKFILAFFKHGICRSDSFKKTNKNYKLFILKKAINFKFWDIQYWRLIIYPS